MPALALHCAFLSLLSRHALTLLRSTDPLSVILHAASAASVIEQITFTTGCSICPLMSICSSFDLTCAGVHEPGYACLIDTTDGHFTLLAPKIDPQMVVWMVSCLSASQHSLRWFCDVWVL